MSGVLLAGEAAIAQHLGLEGADEGLGPGVVIGVGSGRHALLHACGTQPLTKSAAAILAAAVTVEDDALGAASGDEGGVEGLDDQIAAQVIAQTSANDSRGASPLAPRQRRARCAAVATPSREASAPCYDAVLGNCATKRMRSRSSQGRTDFRNIHPFPSAHARLGSDIEARAATKPLCGAPSLRGPHQTDCCQNSLSSQPRRRLACV